MDDRLKRQLTQYRREMQAAGRLPRVNRRAAWARVEAKWNRTPVGDYLRANEARRLRDSIETQRDEAIARAERAEAELAALRRERGSE